MQFRQPIYTSDLEYELMGIEGIKSINKIELTQDTPSWGTQVFTTGLYDISIDSAGNISSGNNTGYGYEYEFEKFYNGEISSDGTILPSVEPAVFELKNPNENVKGDIL